MRRARVFFDALKEELNGRVRRNSGATRFLIG